MFIPLLNVHPVLTARNVDYYREILHTWLLSNLSNVYNHIFIIQIQLHLTGIIIL